MIIYLFEMRSFFLFRNYGTQASPNFCREKKKVSFEEQRLLSDNNLSVDSSRPEQSISLVLFV